MSKSDGGDTIDNALPKVLSSIPLFSSLSLEECKFISKLCTHNSYKKGETVIKQGDIGTKFYLISKGTATVYSGDKKVAQLASKDYFGERSLLTKKPRSATIIAEDDLECLEMSQEDFRKIIKEKKFNLRLAKRAAITNSPTLALLEQFESKKEAEKLDERTKEFLLAKVPFNLFSSVFTEKQKEFVIENMKPLTVEIGTEIVKEGQFGSEMYLIHSGEVLVSKRENSKTKSKPNFKTHNHNKSPNLTPKELEKELEKQKLKSQKEEKQKILATLTNGQYFGELALLYKCARSATVTASRPTLLYVLPNYLFRLALAKNNMKEQEDRVKFLSKVPILKSLLSNEFRLLARNFEELEFKEGQKIIEQDEEGNSFFIIKKGSVFVEKDGEKIGILGEGNFFGEMALLTSEKRNASIIACEHCVCFMLTKNSFDSLLGPLKEIIKESGEERKNHRKKISKLVEKDLEKLKIDEGTKSFEIIAFLGRGAFGTVKLARHIDSGIYVALKSLSIREIEKSKTISHLRNEKDSLIESKCCPFIIRLYNIFVESSKIFFVLEVALGGELFSLLRKQGHFDEKTSRFYAASIILAFKYLHEKGIVYRDLKPENIVMTKEGYVKLIDLGFAKKLGFSEKTYTLCGTPDYIAPEVITGSGHDKAVDLWTLGIFLFEMNSGYPPFRANDELGLFTEILHRDIKFPRSFSNELKDLISRLVDKNAKARIGGGKKGIDEIMKHKWFKEFDWEEIRSLKMKAPFLPKVKNESDISNFSQDEVLEEDLMDDLGNFKLKEMPVWVSEFDERIKV